MMFTALLPLVLASSANAAPEAPLAPAPAPLTAADEPTEGWTGSVSAGAVIRTGNTKSRQATATADATWRKEKDRVSLGALWSYQEDNHVVTQRKIYGAAKYDRFLSEKTFAYAQTSGDADKLAGLDLRWTIGAGAGRQFRDDETWKFSAEAGVSHISEDFTVSGTNDYVSARLAYNANYKHNDSWELSQDAEVYPSIEDRDDVYARVDTRAKLTLTESMFAQFQWVMDYDNTPDAGKERIDHLFGITVGWSF